MYLSFPQRWKGSFSSRDDTDGDSAVLDGSSREMDVAKKKFWKDMNLMRTETDQIQAFEDYFHSHDTNDHAS